MAHDGGVPADLFAEYARWLKLASDAVDSMDAWLEWVQGKLAEKGVHI
jgi:hypothetical protein